MRHRKNLLKRERMPKMIKNRICTGLLIIICFLLQTTVFHGIALAGVVPNLMLILTVSIAYMRGRTEGLIIGLICGLLFDMQFGNVIGLYGFIYMAIGFVIGYCQKVYFTDEYILPLVLISISDFVYGIYYYIVEFLLRGRLHFGFYLWRVILPELIYTLVVSIILYRFFLFL